MIVIGSLNYRVLRALAEAPGRQLQAHHLAAAAGATAREFQKRAARMVADGLISRAKVRDDDHAYYWYSLTDAQLAKYRLVAALAIADQTAGAALVVEEVDLPGRLSFLHMLSERTVFRDHSVLAAIISDYERTARLRRSADHHQPKHREQQMNQRFKQLQRLRPSRRVGATMIAFAIPLVLGWYAGLDMLARGPGQAWCLYAAISLAGIVWTCPIWPKKKQNTITSTQEAK